MASRLEILQMITVERSLEGGRDEHGRGQIQASRPSQRMLLLIIHKVSL
jgi:hypothetical protein